MFLRWSLCLSTLTISLAVDALPPPSPRTKSSTPVLLPPPLGEAFFHDDRFNDGAYGLYVNRTFKSCNVIAPRINFEKPFTDCDDGSHLFITPRGAATKSSAVILDANGSLIWTPGSDLGQVYNFQVQRYQGQNYLTFWSGNDSVGGHGAGAYYMFDHHYQLHRTINAGNGLGADLHSFDILPDGNALLTAYKTLPADFSRMEGQPLNKEHWVWDSVFQEFNLETGEVVFEWYASHHFAYPESYNYMETDTEQEPWDWFHINSVEKDDLGNYLISARHLRCIAYISGASGEVLWRLGGKKNDFTDLSFGAATRYVGQHDAHWDEGGKFITMFDNRADWQFEMEHVSKGTRIEVDLERMTAKINTSFVHPREIFAFSQGSYQTLPSGNVLIGYGYTGAMTEFAPNGTVLCDAYFGPASRFSSGDVQSYKDLKFAWTGVPLTQPNLVAENGRLFMSWHGATEVRSWWLQDSHYADGPFGPLRVIPKTGFETSFALGLDDTPIRRYVRVVALDRDEEELAASAALDVGDFASQWPASISDSGKTSSMSDDPNLDEALVVGEPELEHFAVLLDIAVLAIIGVLLAVCALLWPQLLRQWRLLTCDEYGMTVEIKDHPKELTIWQSFWRANVLGSRLLWKDKLPDRLFSGRGSEDSRSGLLAGAES